MKMPLTSTCLLLAFHTTQGFSFHCEGCYKHEQPALVNAIDSAAKSDRQSGEREKSRRKFLLTAGALAVQGVLVPTNSVKAEQVGDMTSDLFNPDGSLKEGQAEEAKVRSVEIKWDGATTDKYMINVDGKSGAGTQDGSGVRLSYKVPEKWEQRGDGYFDKSTTDVAKACQRITVYRAPGNVSPERLAKAATIGIAEALYVTDVLQVLKGADLISGRTRQQGDVKFFDFDMAVAPKTCSDSPENLGLGFCPFDAIYLISAAVFNDALYVLALECDKSEWKIANSDLKRVRSSFAVDL